MEDETLLGIVEPHPSTNTRILPAKLHLSKSTINLHLCKLKIVDVEELVSVMVIVVGNGHSDPTSKPQQGCLLFTLC